MPYISNKLIYFVNKKTSDMLRFFVILWLILHYNTEHLVRDEYLLHKDLA